MNAIYVNMGMNTFESRIERRDRLDLLRSRIYLLRGRDRLLMTMYLENGNTINQMARISDKSPSTIYRRIRKLTKLLLDGEYFKCLQFRDQFSKTEMQYAREYFLEGFSFRKIARIHCSSAYKVRKMVMGVHGVLEGKE